MKMSSSSAMDPTLTAFNLPKSSITTKNSANVLKLSRSSINFASKSPKIPDQKGLKGELGQKNIVSEILEDEKETLEQDGKLSARNNLQVNTKAQPNPANKTE